MEEARQQFHTHRVIFQTSGVRPDGFSLPRQHSLDHYAQHIQNFGAPNGLCSSITEAKHIKAVKEPWRRSNRYEALGQMLLTNQRNEKLAAARADFDARGMLAGTCLSDAILAIQADLEEDPQASDAQQITRNLYGDEGDEDEDEDEDRDDDDDLNVGNTAQDSVDRDGERNQRELHDAAQTIQDSGVVNGPHVDGAVRLAHKPRKYPPSLISCQSTISSHANRTRIPARSSGPWRSSWDPVPPNHHLPLPVPATPP